MQVNFCITDWIYRRIGITTYSAPSSLGSSINALLLESRDIRTLFTVKRVHHINHVSDIKANFQRVIFMLYVNNYTASSCSGLFAVIVISFVPIFECRETFR